MALQHVAGDDGGNLTPLSIGKWISKMVAGFFVIQFYFSGRRHRGRKRGEEKWGKTDYGTITGIHASWLSAEPSARRPPSF